VREIAELGEHQRDSLVVRQPRDVGQDRTQLLAACDLAGQMVIV